MTDSQHERRIDALGRTASRQAAVLVRAVYEREGIRIEDDEAERVAGAVIASLEADTAAAAVAAAR